MFSTTATLNGEIDPFNIQWLSENFSLNPSEVVKADFDPLSLNVIYKIKFTSEEASTKFYENIRRKNIPCAIYNNEVEINKHSREKIIKAAGLLATMSNNKQTTYKLSDGTETANFIEWNQDNMKKQGIGISSGPKLKATEFVDVKKMGQAAFEDLNPIARTSELSVKNIEKRQILENLNMLNLTDPWLKHLKFSVETVDQHYYDADLNRYVSDQCRKATFEIAFNQIVNAQTFLSRIQVKGVNPAFTALNPEGKVHVTSYFNCFGRLCGEGLRYIEITLKLLGEKKPELKQEIDQFAKNVMQIN